MHHSPRRLLVPLAVAAALTLVGCTTEMKLTPVPTQTVTVTVTPTPTPTPTPSPTPTPTPTAVSTPEPPPPPLPPTPPNASGGQTDGGNTPTTPEVEDTGPQSYAVGKVEQVNEYEYRYTVVREDQVLAIASRFNLQVMDILRVNFPCSDPLNVQPGDVLDIRWPTDSEQHC